MLVRRSEGMPNGRQSVDAVVDGRSKTKTSDKLNSLIQEEVTLLAFTQFLSNV